MIDTSLMEPHQQRVIEEARALSLKIEALTDFLIMPPNIGVVEIRRLAGQVPHMRAYLAILNERIGAFLTVARTGSKA